MRDDRVWCCGGSATSSSASASFLEAFSPGASRPRRGPRRRWIRAGGIRRVDDVSAGQRRIGRSLLDPDLGLAEARRVGRGWSCADDSPFGLAHCLVPRALVDLRVDRVDRGRGTRRGAGDVRRPPHARLLAHCLEAIAACVAADESERRWSYDGRTARGAESLRSREGAGMAVGSRGATGHARTVCPTLLEQELDAAMAAGAPRVVLGLRPRAPRPRHHRRTLIRRRSASVDVNTSRRLSPLGTPPREDQQHDPRHRHRPRRTHRLGR